jgi:hypothetical protein
MVAIMMVSVRMMFFWLIVLLTADDGGYVSLRNGFVVLEKQRACTAIEPTV